MKAYRAYWAGDDDHISTVVFANSAIEAKNAVRNTEFWADSDQIYTDLRVNRIKSLDAEYRGHTEMDWDDDQDRIALAKDGWHCLEKDDECDKCKARKYCDLWEWEREDEDNL